MPGVRRARRAVLMATVLLVSAAPVAGAAVAPSAVEDRVRDVVREERVRDVVRRVASISGDIRTSEAPGTVQVDLSADVLFAFDSAALSPDASARISEVASRVGAEASGPVAVVGHTDSLGDDAYNQSLSEQRAAAVTAALQAAAPSTYQAAGRGESEPVAPNEVDGQDNPAGRQLNRRVTITFPTAG